MAKPEPIPKPSGLVFNAASHRYKLDGKSIRGVTGLMSAGLPKDALIGWAAEQAAIAYLGSRAEFSVLAEADPDEFTKRLKWAHREVRDAAAVTGTRVHHLAEELARTGEVAADDDVAGYIDGYADFLDLWQITPVLMERPVANRKDWWAGTFDLLATSPFLAGGKIVQIDLKTSKGVYGETALQTAAYSRAEFYVTDDGHEVPMPKVHATYVAHVTPLDREGINVRYAGRPNGTTLYPMAETPEEIDHHYDLFKAAAYTAKTAKERDQLGRTPLTHPSKESI